MNLRFVLLLMVCGFSLVAAAQQPKPLRVFVRTAAPSGHAEGMDPGKFLENWKRLLGERGVQAQGAARFPTRAELNDTDVLLLCGSEGGFTKDEQRNLERFLRAGGGLVVLHHGMYQTNVAWFKGITGGAWDHSPGSRHEEALVGLYFHEHSHPLASDLSNFDLRDESYYPIDLLPNAKVVASTFHTAKEIVPQIWTYTKARYRVFVALPGHDTPTFEHPAYRGLLLRGIAWTGKRAPDSLLNSQERESFRYPPGGPTAPAEARAKLKIAPEFDLNLVASEPLVVKPISIDWDARGRMWVAQTPEYPFKTSSGPGKDSIVILEDSNGDGQMDQKQVFYEGLNLVTSFVFDQDGVIVAQAPQILRLRDVDGDGVADRREVLYQGFGNYDTHAVISNFRRGLDGWIYATQGYSGNQSEHITGADGRTFGKIGNGIFRFKADGSAIEMLASYGGNSWGLDFRWDGELFFSKANGPHISHLVLPERFFLRGRLGTSLSDKSIEDHQKVYPIFGDKRHEYVQVSPVGLFTAASGAMLYEGAAWPERFHSSYFVCEPTVHIVHEDVISAVEGSPTFEATKSEEEEFLAGTDLWFRPVHTRFGPDGAVYILDFYNQAISHNDIRGIRHGPGNAAVRPDRDHEHGRIWRVQYREPRRFERPILAGGTPAGWAAAFEHPNAWVRQTAQRLLVERGGDTAVASLTNLLRSSRQAFARVHALWTLQQLGKLEEERLLTAIADPHWDVQRNALLVVAGRLQPLTVAVERTIIKQITSDSERVRLAAFCALGAGPARDEVVRAVVKAYPDLKDGWTKSAALYAAALAPRDYLKRAFDSDKSDSLRDLSQKLVEHIAADQDETAAAEVLVEAAKHSDKKDKLKIAVLEAFNREGSFHPAWTEESTKALSKLLESKNRLLSLAALPLAMRRGAQDQLHKTSEKIIQEVMQDLEKKTLKDEERTQLLTSLAGVPQLQAALREVMHRLLLAGVAPAVQRQIITELTRAPSKNEAQIILEQFSKFDKETRQHAFAALTKRRSSTLALLEAMDNSQVRWRDLTLEQLSRLKNHPDKAVATRAQVVMEAFQGPQEQAKDLLIARFKNSLLEPANLKNGETLFEQNCALCHKLDGKGKTLGPDLTGMGLHGGAVLLTHILDPDRVVEGNYISYNARTKDGEDYYGLMVRENQDVVVLRNLEGEKEIRRADIASLKSSGLSMMPEGLEGLGETNIRDIISYIISKGPTGFRALDLAGAFTADSRKGLYAEQGDVPQLDLKKYGIVTVEDIPFLIVNPLSMPEGKNLIVLKGGSGYAKTLPQEVRIPVGSKAAKIHVLGGVAGWGYPYGAASGHHLPAVRVTITYYDGQREEIILRNGDEFADYIRPTEVPGSKQVEGLVDKGQLRWFSLTPKRSAEIESLTLTSFDNHLAPTFLALTAQVE